MASIKLSGIMKYKDTDGNLYQLHPTTIKDNVEGMEEIDAHIADSTVHVTSAEKEYWNAKAAALTETDPTVPDWAKAENKPSYTASEVGAAEVDHAHDSFHGVTLAGDGTTYTATVEGITTMATGVGFVMIPNVVSASTTPTLNVNGLGAKTMRRPISGSTSLTTAGGSTDWLSAGKPVRVTYNGIFWIVDNAKPNANDLYGNVLEEKLPESVASVRIRSSTTDSTKVFELTVDDSGTITVTEVT